MLTDSGLESFLTLMLISTVAFGFMALITQRAERWTSFELAYAAMCLVPLFAAGVFVFEAVR